MKKIILLVLCILLVGCNAKEEDIINKLKEQLNVSSYYMKGNLTIINNEDSYSYDVEIAYEKENKFKVVLNNKINNHTQIILRNDEGVYVLTPSLNKSFKFQSDWPYNNSQIYLIQTVINDIINDSSSTIEKVNNEYIYTSSVNYANNSSLIKQKVYIDKDATITKVDVIDDKDNVLMTMEFTEIDMNHDFSEDYFNLESSLNVSSEVTNYKTTIDKIIFPLYLPDGTYLETKDVVDTETGQRAILTFGGAKPFMLVEETLNANSKIISMFGEPILVSDTIGALSESSLTWYSNGIEYYITASNMTQDELINIASSLGNIAVSK